MAPSAARDAVDRVLAGRVPERALSEARLLVSEVVTNAVRHGPDGDDTVELSVQLGGGVVRIDVADSGGGFIPPGEDPEAGHPGGWGLVVVDRLADRWGVDGSSGTRVWFELEVAPNATSGGALAMAATARNV